jgi:excinuclease ABC subunit A
VKLGEGEQARAIYEVSHATLSDAHAWFHALKLTGAKAEIADKVVREIATRLQFLNDVGLSYLSLDRSAETLSGGEAQRIRLASQIGSGLTGVMYVLDEPSIGLHQRDNDRLIATLKHLRDIGNSVIVVEHDEDMMRAADHVIDMGPGAGVHGGRVMAQGTYDEVRANAQSLTGQYLSGARSIAVPKRRTPWLPVLEQAAPVVEAKAKSRFPQTEASKRRAERMAEHHARQGAVQALRVAGATGNNLKGVTVDFPVGLLTCVTGVSGSGKSTLVNDTLYAAVARQIHRAHDEPAEHEEIVGIEYFDKVINVDQSPIGRTPRSNPATYTGLFTPIRELMAETNTAKERGYGPGRFSFNVGRRWPLRGLPGRRRGEGGDALSARRVRALRHLPRPALQPRDAGSAVEGQEHRADPGADGGGRGGLLQGRAHHRAQAADAAGCGPVLHPPGPGATTLSGGEAQRVKLAQELSKRDTGRTLYILDEPTTGLHFADIDLLLKVLHQLRDAGNTIVIIEHNLDVIKTADWLIDMGPEGGAGGGTVVGVGTPEELAANPASHTGQMAPPPTPAPGRRACAPSAGCLRPRPAWRRRCAARWPTGAGYRARSRRPGGPAGRGPLPRPQAGLVRWPGRTAAAAAAPRSRCARAARAAAP